MKTLVFIKKNIGKELRFYFKTNYTFCIKNDLLKHTDNS